MKKAQGMPINVIVIAAIALVVLVVLAAILMGNMGIFTRQSKSCIDTLSGKCQNTCVGDAEGYTKEYKPGVCFGLDGKPDTTKVCCVVGS